MPGNLRRPERRLEAAGNRLAAGSPRITDSRDFLTQHTARCVQDAMNEGLAATWERRRAAFLAARPRAGDFTGRATREDLRRRWYELTAIADACGARAAVSLRHKEIDPDVWEAITC